MAPPCREHHGPLKALQQLLHARHLIRPGQFRMEMHRTHWDPFRFLTQVQRRCSGGAEASLFSTAGRIHPNAMTAYG